jgi:hypothetical protein
MQQRSVATAELDRLLCGRDTREGSQIPESIRSFVEAGSVERIPTSANLQDMSQVALPIGERADFR